MKKFEQPILSVVFFRTEDIATGLTSGTPDPIINPGALNNEAGSNGGDGIPM